jgi:serine/threonine protein phosphatase 1
VVVRADLRDHPGRVFALGDLHGMAHVLDDLLRAAAFDPDRDLLWSLGDLPDRGPFSRRCLALLDEPWFRAVRGNHEQLMLDAPHDREAWLNWILNGGDWALDQPWDDPELLDRLARLPFAADLETACGHIGLVHADVERGCTWPEFLEALEQGRGLAREVALWSRTSANQAVRGLPGREIEGVDLVLVGHSIMETAIRRGNIWFLDSGAVVTEDRSAALTMLEIHPELRLWSLPTAGDPVAARWWRGYTERMSFVGSGPAGGRLRVD